MSSKIEEIILGVLDGKSASKVEAIQSLWSGYGSIDRYKVVGGSSSSVVVKHVKLPTNQNHPRGWNTDLSHNRKVRSYEIETTWYRDYNRFTNSSCKTPNCLALETIDGEVVIILEDLDDSGYYERKSSVNFSDIRVVLSWLANFHANFMMVEPTGLWEIGTYWHLDTRPEELAALEDGELKKLAPKVDDILNKCKYKTLVHGDAKLANFCFSKNGEKVSAVDFQYIGGGCGMKDVAYFLGSCLYEDDCESFEKELLDYYFTELKLALSGKYIDSDEVVAEWQDMYYVAWTDFHRFLKWWSPTHWKINSYSERVSREVIAKIKAGNQ
jgi:hypothetical protein